MSKFYAADPLEEKILRRIPWEILILAFIIALLSLLFFDPTTSLFIFVGGMLSALSFVWLKQAITKFLFFEKKKALRISLVLYVLRLLLIIAVFSIIILLFSKRIIAFAVGFSTIIAVILVEAFVVFLNLKTWKT